MIRTAREMVHEWGGLALSLEQLNLERVIQRAGVPRTTVYRIWENKDAFLVDLLCDLAGSSWHRTVAFSPATLDVVMRTYLANMNRLYDNASRYQVVRELVRVGAERNFMEVCTSPEWQTYVALTATAMSLPDEDARGRVVAALKDAERIFVSRMVRFYALMMEVLGLRLRAPFSLEQLAVTGAAVVEGLGLRLVINPTVVQGRVEWPSLDDKEVPWSLAAIGFLGILEEFVELDLAWRPMERSAIKTRFTRFEQDMRRQIDGG